MKPTPLWLSESYHSFFCFLLFLLSLHQDTDSCKWNLPHTIQLFTLPIGCSSKLNNELYCQQTFQIIEWTWSKHLHVCTYSKIISKLGWMMAGRSQWKTGLWLRSDGSTAEYSAFNWWLFGQVWRCNEDRWRGRRWV